MIISKGEEIEFDKIQCPFMIKNTQQTSQRRKCPQSDNKYQQKSHS